MPSSFWKPTLQWPLLPAHFWLTITGTGLALVSLVFTKELWYSHPQAGLWSWWVLGIGVAAGCLQVLQILWYWPVATHYAGPRLLWPIVCFMRMMVFIGIALFFILLLLLLLVLFLL